MPLVNHAEWSQFLNRYPDAHLLQTAAWGTFKQPFGWVPKYLISEQAGAMILFKKLPLGLTIAYVPKGPVGTGWKTLLEEMLPVCKEENAILVYIEPDMWEEERDFHWLKATGFSPTDISIQPRQTIVVSLSEDQEVWLKRMKQKTRYNIRLATRKDVIVEQSSDMDTFCELMDVTGERDDFGIHDTSYYKHVYQLFIDTNACAMFLAKYQGIPLAALMVFARGKRAWYFYGASNNQERNRMPTYLLQWKAMIWASNRGAELYDLWGIPDHPESELEDQFTSRSDGLWGVYRFKRGFGGEIKRSAGVYQKVLNPVMNTIYQFILKYRKSLVS